MFQIHHFSYRLWANKVSSKASFSNWHNSSAIFGGQILQIQDCRPHWYIKNLQLVHRNHFYTGNYDISSPIDDNTNSSWPISSMAETSTNIKQHEIRTEIPDIDTLYPRYISLNDPSRKVLNLKLIKGKNGHKFFLINFFDDYNKFELNFPKIPVPADAYAFVRKIDELMGEFADQKFQDNVKENAAGDDRKPKPIAELKRHIAVMAGLFHKFQLELYIFPYLNPKYRQQKQLCIIRLCALNLESKKLTIRSFFLPLEALLWLREQMVDMLERHDGAETIEREAPAKIPKQFRMNGLILTEAIE